MNLVLLARVGLAVLSPVVLSGCGLRGLRDRWDDNAEVRAEQEASVAAAGERPVAGKSVDEFFRDKVGLISVKGGTMPVGRAAPVSADGYHLTAWHVVEEGEIQLSETVVRGTRVHTAEHPGRVVWHDPRSDLAVVKFDVRPGFVFRPRAEPLAAGDAVFSGAGGANGGVLVIPPNESGHYDLRTVLESGRGNGPYRTAGTVVRRMPEDARGTAIHASTLVGRAGMSGGPVVDREGRLVGIVTGARVRWFSTPTTFFSMLGAEELEAILREDRRRR